LIVIHWNSPDLRPKAQLHDAGVEGSGFRNIAAAAKMVSWNRAIVSRAGRERNNWAGLGDLGF
jgi:hypothetical protein